MVAGEGGGWKGGRRQLEGQAAGLGGAEGICCLAMHPPTLVPACPRNPNKPADPPRSFPLAQAATTLEVFLEKFLHVHPLNTPHA